MKILLDTHALIWFLDGNKKLSQRARNEIENNKNVNFVSIASIWEIAIKISLGKLQMSIDFEKLSEILSENGFQILPIRFEHTLEVSCLPFHHRDPFDRIIISQGIVDNMPIISGDDNFAAYAVERIW